MASINLVNELEYEDSIVYRPPWAWDEELFWYRAEIGTWSNTGEIARAWITARLRPRHRSGLGAVALAKALIENHVLTTTGEHEWTWEGESETSPGYPHARFLVEFGRRSLLQRIWSGLYDEAKMEARRRALIRSRIIAAQEMLWDAMEEANRLACILQALEDAERGLRKRGE